MHCPSTSIVRFFIELGFNLELTKSVPRTQTDLVRCAFSASIL